MQNEAETIARGTELSVQMMLSLMQFLNQMYSEMCFRNDQKKIAESLMRVTENGTKLPYLQPFGPEHSKFAHEVVQQIKIYNHECAKNGRQKERVDFYVTKMPDGTQVIWTNEAGMRQIEKIKANLAISKGLYYTEIKASELYEANLNKEILAIRGVDSTIYNILKNKPLSSGNEFSFATTDIRNGRMTIGVSELDFINPNMNEDMFTNLIRAQIGKDGELGEYIEENAKYDESLLKKTISHAPGDEELYITSATDGGRYIKINDRGFQVCAVGLDGVNVKQVVLKDVLRPLPLNKTNIDLGEDRDKQQEAYSQELMNYQKSLISEINKMSRPVGIDQSVFDENAAVFTKTFGKDLRNDEHTRAKRVFYNAFLSRETQFDDPKSSVSISKIQKAIMNDSKNALMADVMSSVAEKLHSEKNLNSESFCATMKSENIKKELRSAYLKDFICYMNPDLVKEYIVAVGKNPDLIEMKKQYNDEQDMELKKEMGKMLAESFDDFSKSQLVPPHVKTDLYKEFDLFADEIIKKSQETYKMKCTPQVEKAASHTRHEQTNDAMNVIIANCITGKNIEGLRPTDVDLESLRKAETTDLFVKCMAKEIESKIIEMSVSNPELSSLSPVQIVQTTEYRDIVKSVSDNIINSYNAGSLASKSPEWKTIVAKGDEMGLFSKESMYKLQNAALKINKMDFSEELVTDSRLKNVLAEEKSNISFVANHWRDVDLRKNEEELNTFLKDGMYKEDLDIDGEIRANKVLDEDREFAYRKQEEKERRDYQRYYDTYMEDRNGNGIDDHLEFR